MMEVYSYKRVVFRVIISMGKGDRIEGERWAGEKLVRVHFP